MRYTLTLLPKSLIFTPTLKPKPKAPSSTLGIVIGESDDMQSQRGTKRISNGKQSYYEDIGGNKMLITYEKIIQALKNTKEQGGY